MWERNFFAIEAQLKVFWPRNPRNNTKGESVLFCSLDFSPTGVDAVRLKPDHRWGLVVVALKGDLQCSVGFIAYADRFLEFCRLR